MRTKPPPKSAKGSSLDAPGTLRTDHEMESDALGCHPSEVARFRKEAKDHGLTGVEFRKDGTAVFSSIREKRRYERAYNYVNKTDFM